MTDLILRGGTVVDGSGNRPFVADVAIADGRIVSIGPDLQLQANEEIDASGFLVTPGFIDIHTHYDGQVTWDTDLLPSAGHGVTTAVIGCCGIGFAPVRPGSQDWLIRLMEGVEDIPGSALHVGLPWTWETYPEYLDTLASRQYAFDIASQIPHSAVRAYVLGSRAETDEPATDADLAEITSIIRDGMRAGAIGVGTSRVVMHRGSDGGLLPGTYAAEDELMAIADAMKESGGGIFQIVPSGSGGGVEGAEGESLLAGNGERRDRWTLSEEIEMMRRVHRRTGGIVTFSLTENRGLGREEFVRAQALIEEIKEEGEAIFPQFSPRPIGSLTTLSTYHAFMARPSYIKLKGLPLNERVIRMRDPSMKAAILAEEDVPSVEGDPMKSFHLSLRNNLRDIYVLEQAGDYEPDPGSSVVELARAASRDPLDLLYDLYLQQDGKAVLAWLSTNYLDGDLRVTEAILRDPQYLIGLGDAGAHVRVICDASYTTFLLVHWGRDRLRGCRLPTEMLIRKLTGEPAAAYGFSDRGLLRPGLRADINIIDVENLALGVPRLVSDLPAEAERFLQDARGYVRTLVAGVTTRLNDEDTGARPGRLVRRSAAANATSSTE